MPQTGRLEQGRGNRQSEQSLVVLQPSEKTEGVSQLQEIAQATGDQEHFTGHPGELQDHQENSERILRTALRGRLILQHCPILVPGLPVGAQELNIEDNKAKSEDYGEVQGEYS